MTSRFAQIRYALRSLAEEIVGYCDVLALQSDAPASPLPASDIGDISSLARSVANSLDAPRLNATQLGTIGRRLLTLSASVNRWTGEVQVGPADGSRQLAIDVARLRRVATRLAPLGHELLINAEGLAAQAGSPSAEQPAPALARPVTADHLASPLLVVDDNAGNRDLLARRLMRAGYSSVSIASNGREALEALRARDFDLVLLDVMMPEIDGIGVLREAKQDPRLRDVPIIMISAVDDVASVAQCIELGAEDYLPKPFDQVILQARIRGSLERKRLRDADRLRTAELEQALLEVKRAREVSEDLLRNILPATVAEELREKNAVDPMYFEDSTIVFTDFVGFTASTEALSADELVWLLHDYFTGIDHIMERYGLEKLKTIGDSYMYVGGLPVRNPAHPIDAIMAAFDIIAFVRERSAGDGPGWRIRLGVHTGPVIAGVVGVRKFSFDVWGESVNVASRMESSGVPDRINVSERTYSRVKDFFQCEARGPVKTKDGLSREMYLVNGVLPKLLADDKAFANRYRTYFGRTLPDFPASLRLSDQQDVTTNLGGDDHGRRAASAAR